MGVPMISHVQLLGAILRMVAAVMVGCIVGLDRNLHGKPTGVKTLGLVALGSCLVTMAGMSFELHGFTDGTDAGRAIQGVITGIGFLGAGVILQNRATGRISGLTTAASIWVTPRSALYAASAHGRLRVLPPSCSCCCSRWAAGLNVRCTGAG